jgi:hypothetical protein
MSESDDSLLGDSNAVGNVYIFNVTTRATSAAPILNGTGISSLPAVSQSSNYQVLTVKKVPRIVAATTQVGKFADSNTFTVRLTGGVSYDYAVNIPPNPGGSYYYPYANDVLLYVFDAYLFLCDTFGSNFQTIPGTPSQASMQIETESLSE